VQVNDCSLYQERARQGDGAAKKMDNLPRGIALVTGGSRGWRNSGRNRRIAGVSYNAIDAGREGSAVRHQILGAVSWFEDFKRTWAGGTRDAGSDSVIADAIVFGPPRQFGRPHPVQRAATSQ
jgi:hypothetical protein